MSGHTKPPSGGKSRRWREKGQKCGNERDESFGLAYARGSARARWLGMRDDLEGGLRQRVRSARRAWEQSALRSSADWAVGPATGVRRACGSVHEVEHGRLAPRDPPCGVPVGEEPVDDGVALPHDVAEHVLVPERILRVAKPLEDVIHLVMPDSPRPGHLPVAAPEPWCLPLALPACERVLVNHFHHGPAPFPWSPRP